MTDLNGLASANAGRWENAALTRDFGAAAQHLAAPAAKARYQTVSARTGVPWAVIAVIHERECSQDWTRSLAQGDPWDSISVHVPAGRGPFPSWEAAAVDALANCAPYMARNADWSVGRTLAKLEEYNGFGYAARGVPSPYIWSGTNQYTSGKYVRDGVYDRDAVDRQLGCAGLLKALAALDPSAAFGSGERSVGRPSAEQESPSSAGPTSQRPGLTNPSKGSVGAFIASILAVVFKRR